MAEVLMQGHESMFAQEQQRRGYKEEVVLSSESQPDLDLHEIMARQQILNDLNYTVGEM